MLVFVFGVGVINPAYSRQSKKGWLERVQSWGERQLKKGKRAANDQIAGAMMEKSQRSIKGYFQYLGRFLRITLLPIFLEPVPINLLSGGVLFLLLIILPLTANLLRRFGLAIIALFFIWATINAATNNYPQASPQTIALVALLIYGLLSAAVMGLWFVIKALRESIYPETNEDNTAPLEKPPIYMSMSAMLIVLFLNSRYTNPSTPYAPYTDYFGISFSVVMIVFILACLANLEKDNEKTNNTKQLSSVPAVATGQNLISASTTTQGAPPSTTATPSTPAFRVSECCFCGRPTIGFPHCGDCGRKKNR